MGPRQNDERPQLSSEARNTAAFHVRYLVQVGVALAASDSHCNSTDADQASTGVAEYTAFGAGEGDRCAVKGFINSVC
jgi:hypothetical protein